MRSRGTSGALRTFKTRLPRGCSALVRTPPARLRQPPSGASCLAPASGAKAPGRAPNNQGDSGQREPEPEGARPRRHNGNAERKPSGRDIRPQSAGSGSRHTSFPRPGYRKRGSLQPVCLRPDTYERTRRIPSTRRASRRTRRAPSVTSCRRSHSVRRRAVKTARRCAMFAHHSSRGLLRGENGCTPCDADLRIVGVREYGSSSSTATCIGDNESQWCGTVMTEPATTSAVRSTMRARTASAT
jgi:hypothetical protein